MIITLYAESTNGRLRYYTLHDRQPCLGAKYTLTAARRVESSQEKERVYSFDSPQDMDAMVRRLFALAVGRGYKLLYSFDRKGFGRFGTRGKLNSREDALFALLEAGARA